MTFSELINAVEFDGGLLVRVWDEGEEIYIVDCADYFELTKQELEPLWDLPVTHIYPDKDNYPYSIIELCLEG